ncbi:MAG: TetR/AcrR family transcriptional regulator C-terminal domain-containing protein [Anaerovoracaceae bacterium]|jgi:AcrR family transcriptional regulator
MADITERTLSEGIKKLLQKKQLDKITVGELTRECGISRNTFYYHYHDVYQLLDEMFKVQADEILEGLNGTEDWTRGVESAMDYLYENSVMIRHIVESIRRENLERYLYNVMGKVTLSFVEEQAKGREINDENKKLIAEFFGFAMVGWVSRWAEQGMRESPHEAVSKLSKLLQGTMAKLLTNAEEAQNAS